MLKVVIQKHIPSLTKVDSEVVGRLNVKMGSLVHVRGKDGLTPFINSLGNWQLGNTDTGIRAEGPQGARGDTGSTG